ncbi:MAG: sulfatase-like hydrolase/transferase [Planctomycetota bacterium]
MPRLAAASPADARRPSPLSALLLSLAALAAGCGESEHPLRAVERGEAEVTGQGVLVVVVDGLRWDHTSLAGYDRETTPFLARFSEQCAVFANAWTPVASLLGAHVGLLSGADPALAVPPPAAGGEAASRRPLVVPRALGLVARPFLARAWRTAAFLDHPAIEELSGFDVGFCDFVAYRGRTRVGELADDDTGVTGVGLRFLRWLNERDLDEDWFAYVHLHDLERQWSEGVEPALAGLVSRATAGWEERPELDFVPPIGLTEPALDALPASRTGDGRPRSLSSYELRYDRALRALDVALERLVMHVDEYGRGREVTIVVVGSYGIELGEHGLYLAPGLAAEEDLHVPLLVRPAGRVAERLGFEGGRRVGTLVSTLDVAPTLVELAGLRPLPIAHGYSLVPFLTGDGSAPPVRRRVFARAAFGDGAAVVGTDDAWFDPRGSRARAASDRGSEDLSSPWDGALLPTLWGRWESLLLTERRRLHFGVGEADTTAAELLDALQRDPISALVEHSGTQERDAGGGARASSD